MRPVPALLIVLVVALATTLGYRVMQSQPAAQTQAPAAGVAAGVPQGHVYTGVVEEPDDVNPFTAASSVVRRYVHGFTHEALLDTDPATGALRPALASSYELAADRTVCTFTLREGVRFADGSPLTMADVLFGWDLAAAGHLPLGSVGDAFGRVESAEALDDRRFRLRFRSVQHAILRTVAESWLVAKRQFFVDRVAAQAGRLGQPVPAVATREFALLLQQIRQECGPGTGPYVLDNPPEGAGAWRRRQDLLLVRNEHCWRRQAMPGTWNLGGVRLLFRDPKGAELALLRGEIDWFSGANLDELLGHRPELARDYRKLVYDYPQLGVMRVAWNCRRAPFDDVRVRRALGMLFDREAIGQAFGTAARPALAFAKPGTPEYPSELSPLPLDLPAARRLLREAGFDGADGKPLRVVLLVTQGYAPFERAVACMQDAARKVGVDLQVRARDFRGFVEERGRGEWDGELAMQGFRPSGDPWEFVHRDGDANSGHWQHPDADRLATAARDELDAKARTALLHELHALVHREQPVAFLVHPQVEILFNAHIQAAMPGAIGLWPERFWVPVAFQRQ